MRLVENLAIQHAVVVAGDKFMKQMRSVVEMQTRPAVDGIRVVKAKCLPGLCGKSEGIHATPVATDAIDDVPRRARVVVPSRVYRPIRKNRYIPLVDVEVALENNVDVVLLEHGCEGCRAVVAVVTRREPGRWPSAITQGVLHRSTLAKSFSSQSTCSLG